MSGPLHTFWHALFAKTHIIPLALLVIGLVLNAPITVFVSVAVLLASTGTRLYAARRARAAAE